MSELRSSFFRFIPAIAGVAVLSVGVSSMITPFAQANDDRDNVAAQVDASEARIEQLRSQMEGIDTHLAQVFLELEGLNASIPVAEKELASAQERHDAAEREHEAAQAQLDAAQGELTRLEDEISQAESNEADARQAIGNLARTLYLEGDPSALSVVLTEESARDIAQRLSSVETLSKLQSAALASALTVQEENKNNVVRQGAVKDRISGLEETARKSADEAAKAETEAKLKVDELASLKEKAASKQKQWTEQKAKAAEQLKKQEAEHKAAQEKLAKIDAANRANNVSYVGNGSWGSPLRIGLVMTSPFGWRLHPVLGTSRLHNGTDFAANCGTPIYASAPGVVQDVTFEEAGGNIVYVNHGLKNGNSYITAYVHMEATNVSPGQSVGPDTVLGWVGTTGYSTGCHLHFTMIENGSFVDPMPFL